MYLVIERENPNDVRSFKELSEQQLQAISDTEDYVIVKIEIHGGSAAHPTTPHAFLIMEDLGEERITGGSFRQSGSVVQVV